MQRSARLAEIVEIVRDGRLHLARDIADALEVSVRTIYRDIDTLVASGVPIDGERGIGYMLREPVFLPPMALSLSELEALNLGMAIVQEAADEEMQAAARGVMDKVGEHASNRRHAPKSWGFGSMLLRARNRGSSTCPFCGVQSVEGLKLQISYRSLAEETSTRVIRPLQTEYWGRVWTVSAWCELRGGFRAFRIDRMEICAVTGKKFQPEAGKTVQDYLDHVADQIDRTKHRT